MAILANGGESDDVYFWATHSGAAIDLVMEIGGQRWGFEVKFADAPRKTRSMVIASKDLKLDRLYVVYPGKQSYFIEDSIQVIPLPDLKQVFGDNFA